MHLSQREFARRMGIDNPQNISNWFKRDWMPGVYIFPAAKLLECNAEWLLTGTGTEESDQRGLTIDASALGEIIKGVQDALDVVELDWSPKQTAMLVANLYTLYEETGETPGDFGQLVRLQNLVANPKL
jgi:hypothetical protein